MKNLLNDDSFNSDQFQYDRGLHYGDGLFETIAVKSGVAELLNEHLSRLKKGCERLKFNNINFHDLKHEIERQAENMSKAIIKIIITRGRGGRGYSIPEKISARYLILQYPWPDYSSDNWEKGIAVVKCELILSSQPLLAGIKHLNRLENILARQEFNYLEYQEGLLCDAEQNIIEATSSNVFVVIKNKILTPKLDKSGVSGVMRDHVIKKLNENEVQVDIQNIPYALLLESDEIFLTNSIIGIWPVRTLNERIYPKSLVTRNLMSILNIQA